MVGSNPVIGNQIVDQEGIPMEIDFRNVYASVLNNWFLIPQNEVQALFEHQVIFYDFLNGCTSGIEEKAKNKSTAIVFPNPAASQTTLKFNCQNEWVKIEIMDLTGRSMTVVYDGNLTQATHIIPVDLSTIAIGEYIVTITKKSGVETVKLMKLKCI